MWSTKFNKVDQINQKFSEGLKYLTYFLNLDYCDTDDFFNFPRKFLEDFPTKKKKENWKIGTQNLTNLSNLPSIFTIKFPLIFFLNFYFYTSIKKKEIQFTFLEGKKDQGLRKKKKENRN